MCLYGGHIQNTIKHYFVLYNIQKIRYELIIEFESEWRK